MVKSRLLFPAVAIIAAALGLALSRDVAAFYGDPRFFQSQPAQVNRLIHNVPGDDYLVMLVSAGSNTTKLLAVNQALTAWNNTLRGTPNSLTKYPLHVVPNDDPSGNIVIKLLPQSVGTETVNQHCKKPGDLYDPPACNDTAYPTSHIWVSSALDGPTTRITVTHELGHSLWYDDQYNQYSGTCSPAPSGIMNCSATITAADNNDFQTHYEPTYQSADATYPYTTGSTWSALYQVGEIFVYSPSSLVEWNYYWDKRTDTGGTRIQDFYTSKDTNFTKPSYNVGSRYCFLSEIYNEVGYPGTRPWSPRSQYSCVGAAQVQNAGFLVATSDRNSPTGDTLYIRVKNFAGSSRNLGIFAYPNLNDIGCGYQTLNNLATRNCTVSLARGAYGALAWYAWDGGILSWGYLDFE